MNLIAYLTRADDESTDWARMSVFAGGTLLSLRDGNLTAQMHLPLERVRQLRSLLGEAIAAHDAAHRREAA